MITSFLRYCQILFDGDQIEMNGGIRLTPEGEGERAVATPFKKYYKKEDYIYCPQANLCHLYINNQQMMKLQCQRGYFSLWVSDYF